MGSLTIAGPHWLRDDAARAYLRMRADGCPAGVTSAARSYELQSLFFTNQGRPGWPGKADHPDRSKHVWRPGSPRDEGARALDVPEPARAWVRAHGRRYGWLKDRVSREPWHMEYDRALDPAAPRGPVRGPSRPVPAAAGTRPAPEADMPLTDDDVARIAAAVAAITAPGATSTFATEVHHIKVKVARMEAAERRPEIIFFRVQGDPRWCEADVESRTWAVAPTEDVAARRRDVLAAAGRDVHEWGAINGTGTDEVAEPSAFGQRVPWERVDPADL